MTIIYNPAEPSVASIYAIVGYWVKWPELILTAVFFIILFIAAKTIAGNNGSEHNSDQNPGRKGSMINSRKCFIQVKSEDRKK